MTRAQQAVLVVVFSVLLCVPGVSMLFWPKSLKLYGVERVPFPPFEASAKWLSTLEPAFVSNLGQKKRLVQLHNAIGFHALGDLQNDNVLVGRADWLFLKATYGWESLRSEAPLNPRSAETWRRRLVDARRFLQKRKIPFLYVVVPNKDTVYPEFLPAGTTRARPQTRLDEMIPVLEAAGIDYIDLRPALLGNKQEQLYDRLDSHWNGRGAKVAAELIMQRVAELLNRPPEYAALSSHLVPQDSYGDLISMLSLDRYVTEDSIGLVPDQKRATRLVPPEGRVNLSFRLAKYQVFEVADPSLPRALIIRDSFARMFTDTIAEKFSRSVWLWTHNLDLRRVKSERPDIVIVQIAERFFYDDPPGLVLPKR